MEVAVTIKITLRQDLEDRIRGGDITLEHAVSLQINEHPFIKVVDVKEL